MRKYIVFYMGMLIFGMTLIEGYAFCDGSLKEIENKTSIGKTLARGALGAVIGGGLGFVSSMTIAAGLNNWYAPYDGNLDMAIKAGIPTVLSAVLGWIVASKLEFKSDYQDRFDRINFLIKSISRSPLVACEKEALIATVERLYREKEEPCQFGLERFDVLINYVASLEKGLSELLDKIKHKDGSWYFNFESRIRDLSQKINVLKVEVDKRRDIVEARHQEIHLQRYYEHACERFKQLEEKVNIVLTQELALKIKSHAVKDELELDTSEAVGYLLTLFVEPCSLDLVLQRLRRAVSGVRQLLQESMLFQSELEKVGQYHEGVAKLVDECSDLITRLERDFPFSEFERCVNLIYFSEAYKEELNFKEMQQRHGEMVAKINEFYDELGHKLNRLKQAVAAANSAAALAQMAANQASSSASMAQAAASRTSIRVY